VSCLNLDIRGRIFDFMTYTLSKYMNLASGVTWDEVKSSSKA
jgi:hypothetical protein